MIKTTFSGERQLKQALKKEVARLREMSKNVLVGYPETTGNNKVGTSIVMVAAVHEFGSDHVPARPTLRVGVSNARKDIESFIAERAPFVIDGIADPGSVMAGVGAIAQAAVQQEITDLKSPPNLPATIRRKGSSNPLIDTGEMRGSVTFVVTNEPMTEGI